MGISAPGANDGDRMFLNVVLSSGYDKEMLKLFREQTAMLVVLARVVIDEKKQQYEMSKPKEWSENRGA